MHAIPWLIINSLSYALSSFVTSGSYFKLHYGEDTSEASLKPEHFQCDRDNSCTHLARVKSGKLLKVNGENELKNINEVVCIWEKVKVTEKTATPAKAPACSTVFALGMEKEDIGNGVQKIPNGNIQASSSSYSNPYDARLNGMKFWRPSVQSGAYLQVYFGRKVMMHAVATQGKDYSWVQAYKLSYGNDGSSFKFVLADKSTYPRMFFGNGDGTNAVKNDLLTPVALKYVRIHPVSYVGNIVLRAEFYGCFI